MPKICNYETCNNYVFGGGFCRNHQYLRTDKLAKPPKRQDTQYKIKQVSQKQAILNRTYAVLRPKFLAEHPRCMANLAGCTHYATEIHHMKGRGIYMLVISTWLGVCRNCHQWIEMHPKEAKEMDFSQTRSNNNQ